MQLEYDGTRYQGFQWQPDAPTIQSALELAIEKTTDEKVRVLGAGRTDSGVHARGQVAAFLISSELSAETLLHALNHYLDDDISVHRAAEADLGFDPRHDAMSRRYHYSILNSPTRSPLLRGHTCHVRGNLDVSMMDRAAGHLVGSHDFTSFSRVPTGIWRLDYSGDHGGLHLNAGPDGDTGNGGQRLPYPSGAAHCRCAGTGWNGPHDH